MASFLETIFSQLQRADGRVILREIHGDEFISITGRELLDLVQRARAWLLQSELRAGDRCAILGANSMEWIAIDLALMAEGFIVVPLYSRQATPEIVAMMRDCQPALFISSDEHAAAQVRGLWSDGPRAVGMSEVLRGAGELRQASAAPKEIPGDSVVTIIYTSGTSGEAKGVCLTVANVTHMLRCTTERLNELTGETKEPDRVFHYLPFNFAGSWILLLSCLSRESVLTLSTDLNKLVDEIRLASPHYFLNVPTLLERVRRGVEEAIAKRPAILRKLFFEAKNAGIRKRTGKGGGFDELWLAAAQRLIFVKIKQRFGANVQALICGSAPLAPETQEFFMLLGIRVLQAYGLTETTAISTMDDPRTSVKPGFVGPAIPGIEMKLGENEEILIRGPHIFPGYWKRPAETALALTDGWFHSGDQGEVDLLGNWRIIGRIKDLIILNSGHNVAPEPIEDKIAQRLAMAQQVVVVGDRRGYLSVLIAGEAEPAVVQSALDAVNADLPHYRQVRNFTLLPQGFTAENGLLTAFGKVRREAINKRFAHEIDAMYEKKSS